MVVENFVLPVKKQIVLKPWIIFEGTKGRSSTKARQADLENGSSGGWGSWEDRHYKPTESRQKHIGSRSHSTKGESYSLIIQFGHPSQWKDINMDIFCVI